MKVVFACLPLEGKDIEQKNVDITHISEIIKKQYGEEVRILDGIVTGDFSDYQLLAFALQKMSYADIIFVSKDYQDGRDSRIEHDCAKAYGLNIVYE